VRCGRGPGVSPQRRVISPGNDEYVDRAWQLKERVREEDGVLYASLP